MREIKFRGKSKLNNKWHYGSFVKGESEDLDFIVAQDSDLSGDGIDFHSVRVISNTVGQYTGLKDVNGVEIYEHDCLSKRWRVVVYCDRKTGAFMVKWGVAPEINKPITLHSYLARRKKAGTENRDCIVIGNIHDNPNLLPNE